MSNELIPAIPPPDPPPWAPVFERRDRRRPAGESLEDRVAALESRLGELLGGCNYVELCKLTQVVGRMGALVEDLRARHIGAVALAGQIGVLQQDLAKLKPMVEMLMRHAGPRSQRTDATPTDAIART